MAEDRATRIINPKQSAPVRTEIFKGYGFTFFGGGRGCVLSKTLKKHTDVQNPGKSYYTDYKEVTEHFKAKGYILEDTEEGTRIKK